jgi:GT2 family glycosyltransferase
LEYCWRARQAGFWVAYTPEARVVHRLSSSARRDYRQWIENYTTATLAYYARHGSPADLWWSSLFILLGSRFRQLLWLLIGQLGKCGAEAGSRVAGYSKAAALASATLAAARPW